MGYLPISRELLHSSFWRSLAPAERGILVDLMAMAAYKPRAFYMHGYEIQLNRYELCLSLNSFAESLDMGRRRVVSLLERFAKNNLLTIGTILASPSGKELCDQQRKRNCNEGKGYMGRKKFTLITFYPSAFRDENEEDDISETSDANVTRVEMNSETSLATHNKEVLKKEVLKKEKEKNSACAGPSFETFQNLPYKKSWYSMDEIAELEFALADEILADWKEYSGRSEKEVREKLRMFTKKKLRLGLSKMTLDIFDKEFRKEMKQVFALKSKHKNEPVQQLHYFKKR